MLKWLRRILAVVTILIASSVLLPMAYIEGACRPASGAAAATAPAIALPAIDDAGYRRKLNNTFFTFPEWYIVYSFEDFGRFLDRSSESHFNYLGHIFGFWRSFCTINRAVPATGESLTEVKTMIYVIGISYSSNMRSRDSTKIRLDASSNGSGARSVPRRTSTPVPCCRITPRSSTPSPGTNIRSARNSTA
jgi:hypothetical protein